MNRQDKPNGGRGIEWTQPYGIPGYTWNAIKGCMHACEWRMPDGTISECYAKTVAERVAQHAYPNGFAHLAFDEKELNEPRKLKKPAGIFCDSMSDLVGAQVPAEWIEQVIQVMRETPQHIYMLLTKNPPRLKQFQWPENVWIGVSAPPTFMYGKELSDEQQGALYSRELKTLGEIDVPVRWTSIEPLSWDVSSLIETFWHNLEWAVIGAASNGRVNHQPDRKNFEYAFKALGGLPLFLKGNIDRQLAVDVCGKWCEEYPMPTSDWRERRAS
jgi:protein gp37